MTLLEPNNFWSQVPDKWKAFYHYFNAPISAKVNDGMSPLRFIEQLAVVGTVGGGIVNKIERDRKRGVGYRKI